MIAAFPACGLPRDRHHPSTNAGNEIFSLMPDLPGCSTHTKSENIAIVL